MSERPRIFILDGELEQAERIAAAMTAACAPVTWTMRDVLNIALARGLEALEKDYCARV